MISVIIPAYNEAACIEQTLEALAFSQRDAAIEIEIIVADGRSDDSTREIASRHARVISSDRGRAAQMNAGAAAARGDVLLFLHADCLFPRSGFRSLATALADPRVIGGNFDLIFTGGWASRIFTIANRWRRHFNIFYGDSGIFVRAEVFRAMGGYRSMELMEDYEFVRRLVQRGNTAFIRDPLMVSGRRWEETGVVRTLISWFVVHTAYYLGVPPRHLARMYGNVRGKKA